jgi:uncharacterized delta-60 repeat protein
VLADGTLDTSFGADGKADVAMPTGYTGYNWPMSLQIAPDGKIVVAGLISTLYNDQIIYQDLVARFDADGTPDATFGTDGVVIAEPTLFRGGADDPFFMQIQANGDIVLAGESLGTTADPEPLTVIRLGPSGAPDPTFGTGGVAMIPGSPAIVVGEASQPNGQIAVLAFTNAGTTPMLFRFNADGFQDTSLGQSGIAASGIVSVANDTEGVVNDLIAEPDGQLLVLGATSDVVNFSEVLPQAILDRLNPDGSLDKAVTLGYGNLYRADAFALQPNGEIDVVGDATVGPNGTRYVGTFRLTPNLTPDVTFGTDGISTAAPGGYSIFGLAVDPDNRIILAGVDEDDEEDSFTVAVHGQ